MKSVPGLVTMYLYAVELDLDVHDEVYHGRNCADPSRLKGKPRRGVAPGLRLIMEDGFLLLTIGHQVLGKVARPSNCTL